MGDFMYSELEALGCHNMQKIALGTQELEGKTLDLPPAILASYGAFRGTSRGRGSGEAVLVLLFLLADAFALIRLDGQATTLRTRPSSSMVSSSSRSTISSLCAHLAFLSFPIRSGHYGKDALTSYLTLQMILIRGHIV
jgi:hypothetical protein